MAGFRFVASNFELPTSNFVDSAFPDYRVSMTTPEQSFERHAKVVPLYHYVTYGILLVYLVWALWRLVVAPGIDTAMTVLLAIAIALIAFYARAFAVRVQDRVIRLEMRLRLQSLMSADQRARINDLSVAQCVALRFASDAELPGL